MDGAPPKRTRQFTRMRDVRRDDAVLQRVVRVGHEFIVALNTCDTYTGALRTMAVDDLIFLFTMEEAAYRRYTEKLGRAAVCDILINVRMIPEPEMFADLKDNCKNGLMWAFVGDARVRGMADANDDNRDLAYKRDDELVYCKAVHDREIEAQEYEAEVKTAVDGEDARETTPVAGMADEKTSGEKIKKKKTIAEYINVLPKVNRQAGVNGKPGVKTDTTGGHEPEPYELDWVDGRWRPRARDAREKMVPANPPQDLRGTRHDQSYRDQPGDGGRPSHESGRLEEGSFAMDETGIDIRYVEDDNYILDRTPQKSWLSNRDMKMLVKHFHEVQSTKTKPGTMCQDMIGDRMKMRGQDTGSWKKAIVDEINADVKFDDGKPMTKDQIVDMGIVPITLHLSSDGSKRKFVKTTDAK